MLRQPARQTAWAGALVLGGALLAGGSPPLRAAADDGAGKARATAASPPPATLTATTQAATAQASGARTVAAPSAAADESEYVRFARQLGLDLADENDEIRERLARYWYFLTYPTGTLPDQPWERARAHVERFVPDAETWGGPKLRLGTREPSEAISPVGNLWLELGPRPLDSTGTTNNAFQYGIVSGRLNVVVSDAVDRGRGRGDRAWLGFASGGLWRLDGLRSVTCANGNCDASGVTAVALWDDKDLTTQAVSAIEIDPSDPSGDTIYVGTGDFPANDQFSAGIMKTTDGGATWTQLAADVFTPYSKALPPDAAHGGCPTCQGNRFSNQNLKALEVDPNQPATLLAGTRNDLYISHDAGVSWQICSFGNFPTDPERTTAAWNGINRISSIYLDPRGGTTRAYVAVGLIVRDDIDGNGTFDNANNGVYSFVVPASGCPAWPGAFTTHFDGLPTNTGTAATGSVTGRIELAGVVTGSAPNDRLTLYAQISDANTTDAEGTWVVRPDEPTWTDADADGIKDWRQLTPSSSYVDCSNGASSTGQDWYDLHIKVHPTDDKQLYIGHVDLFKGTVNPGYTALTLGLSANLTNVYRTTCASYGKVHPDQHAFAFVEVGAADADYGKWILVGNDGGVYLNLNAGAVDSWAKLSVAGISSNQFYAGQVGQNFAGTDLNGNSALEPNEYGNPQDNKQWVLGGMQDDGCASWDSTTSGPTWTARGRGGDGMWTAFDSLGSTLNRGYWVVESQSGGLACAGSTAPIPGGASGPFNPCAPPWMVVPGPDADESQDWSTPIVMDQFHCNDVRCATLLVGGDHVYVSTAFFAPSYTRAGTTILPGAYDAGSIVALATYPGPLTAGNSAGTVTAGTDNGKWWRSENVVTCSGTVNNSTWSCAANGAATWTEITAPANQQAGSDPFPNRVVAGVAVHPTDDNVVFAAVAGFGTNTPGAGGHVYQASWNGSQFLIRDKSGNLPDVPFQAVAVNPRNPTQVFAGSHWGFYYTDDITPASPTWLRYMEGPLPNAPIFHFSLDRGPQTNPFQSTTMVAFTYGRGAYAVRLPLVGETFCSKPAAPTGLAATTPVANRVDLTWNDSATAAVGSYRVYRATLPGGTYVQVGTVSDGSPGAGGVGTYSFQDTTVSGGVTYGYVVRAVAGACTSADSAPVAAMPAGDCITAPSFVGLLTLRGLAGGTNGQGCGLRVGWGQATTTCSGIGTIVYNVYRSATPGFVPAPANLLAACVGGTSYDDAALDPETSYYYVVRAEDSRGVGTGACGGGREDGNTKERTNTLVATEGFDGVGPGNEEYPPGWFHRGVGNVHWWGAQTCSPRSPPHVLRAGFDGACTDDYFPDGDDDVIRPLSIPADATNVRLSFYHRFQYEAGGDGGALLISPAGWTPIAGGGPFYYVPSGVLSGQGYTSTAAVPFNHSVFGGTSSGYSNVPPTMQLTTVNLSTLCTANTGLGFTPHCAGMTLTFGFNSVSDSDATTGDGWFVDDVAVRYGMPAFCPANVPPPLSFLSATGKSGQVIAQWVNPSTYFEPNGHSRICRSTASFATDAGDTACPLASRQDVNGAANAKGQATFGSLTNGQMQFLAGFVGNNLFPAAYSARQTTRGLPVDVSGPLDWNFATQAANLGTPVAFPGLGIFAAGNDRALHQLQAGSTGGTWPAAWTPRATNAPVQGQPFSLTAAFTGGLGNVVLVSSQDGRVYCFNATSGAPLWTSADFGVLQGRPMVLLRAAGYPGAKDLVIVGTRNAASGNQVVALDLADGSTEWSYGGGAGGGDGTIGIVSGPLAGRPADSRIYVTGRKRAGGSSYTLWALDVTDIAATLAWGLDLGDVDGSPTFHADSGNVLVGNNAGVVHAVTPAGALAASRSLGDGAVKEFVVHDAARDRIYLATSTKVWAIPDTLAAGTDWTVTANAPTRPVLQFGTARVYVGACAASCSDGRLYELDGSSGSGWTVKTFDLAGAGGLGAVVIDRNPEPDLLHAGSRSGRLQAITVPLP
jgi:hypothetical protein